MRNNRKIKTDLENLRILHSLNRINNSPRNMNFPQKNYNTESSSNNQKININTRTIFLEKTTTNSYFPVKVKIFKTRQNGSSYSPGGRSINSRSNSGFNNNSFAYNSIKMDNNNLNLENNVQNKRNSFDININQDNIKYNKNINQITKLKNSLGNPKEARNLMINNMDRNNRFISVSPSQNSIKDDMKDKNNIYLQYNDINCDDNYFDDKHQIRYLLSKDNLNKIKKYNNNLKINNNIENNNRSNSHNLFPRKIGDYDINNINIENSPENKSDIIDINNYQVNSGYKITKKAQMKKKTPNITPILSEDSPYLIPKNQIIQEEIQLNESNNIINSNNIFLNNNSNSRYKIVEIKLDDLIFIEGRLNDIILSLNNNKNIFDIGAINETVEFFIFYFHSSLKNKMVLFFSEQSRLIIKSAFNLYLFIIMITYHLSLNPSMLGKIILLLKHIYNLLKMNLFLLIRKIELYYGDDFCRKNEIYFKTCDYYLLENGLENIYENEITNIIRKNCVSITNDLNNILNYYQTINNNYYNDFRDIFLNISRIEEQDINNYFYNYLFNSTKENIINQQRINKNYDYSRGFFENDNYNEPNDNINNNLNNLIENKNQSIQKESDDDDQYMDKIIESYKINKEIPPFLKKKCPKRYTLVLDLEDTLISVKLINDGKMIIRTRPGLISFLTGVKPYYEIISFSKLAKNYSKIIIEQIEEKRKLFDYNLYREHCILVGRKFEKDISKIGRDMRKIIIVDDMIENLELHKENGILISPYEGDDNKEDRVLYELKKLLILFYNLGYEDLRNALRSYKDEIYEKITLGLSE